ncbi:hypothetical protein BOTBODRAFT_62582 [Botryobasidium botryosum FD-172 SS1]|uniref:Uncharacterized protein n=1 Tax=Botryobasidium botryosum (strain FD-172 SS1) TaxID=930990 RepID=A0A067MXD1_BOTB1|nr:hypothetical protein BOTBODRAFT_62582 [Botryobasidium botryosum FD-172 SS1]
MQSPCEGAVYKTFPYTSYSLLLTLISPLALACTHLSPLVLPIRLIMSALPHSPESPSTSSSIQDMPPVAQRRTSGFRQRVAEKKEAYYKQKALQCAEPSSSVSSYTVAECSPGLASSLLPSPSPSPSPSQDRVPAQSTKRYVRSICVRANENVADICVFVQSPTLTNVEEHTDQKEEEPSEDIERLAVPETPLEFMQRRAKANTAARARVEAHLAELRSQPEIEDIVKKRIIARVEAERARRSQPFGMRPSLKEREENNQRQIDALWALYTTRTPFASPAVVPQPPARDQLPLKNEVGAAGAVAKHRGPLRTVSKVFSKFHKRAAHSLTRLGSALSRLV